MRAVVGLGNPGPEYAATRHNAGFWLADALVARWGFPPFRRGERARVSAGEVDGIAVRVLKPTTYMNASGAALASLRADPAFQPATDLLVLVDELIGEGHSPTHFARQLVRFLRNVTVAKIAGQDSELLQVSSDERARVGRIAELFSEEDLTRHLQIMLRTHGELGYRQEQRFHLELGLLKMAHAQRLLPLEFRQQAGRRTLRRMRFLHRDSRRQCRGRDRN